MKRHGLAALFVGLLLGADSPSDDAQSSLRRLEGTWGISSLESDGVQHRENVNLARYVFKGETWALTLAGQTVERGTLALPATPVPSAIDIIKADSDRPAKGIFTVKGDTMKICFNPDGHARPTTFRGGDGLVLLVLKRSQE